MVQRVLDDPYSDEVLHGIPEEIRRTFSTEQRVAIKRAIAAPRRHGVDLRFVIPLFFTQVYVVLMVGKDRRHSVQKVQHERRTAMQRMTLATLLAFAGLILLMAALALAYVGKSRAGIDLSPNSHLKDNLRQVGL
jgi:hypothetical protein